MLPTVLEDLICRFTVGNWPANKQQTEAALALENFFQNKTRFFNLTGVGGAGKTFTLSNALLQSSFSKIVLSAPTNSAVRVLTQTFQQAAANFDLNYFVVQSSTLFKLFRYKFAYNKLGEEVFLRRATLPLEIAEEQRGALLVVDESSLVDNKYLESIINSLFCKIIFLGDENQLPPVKYHTSPVFDRFPVQVFLRESVRAGNPALLALNHFVRTEPIQSWKRIKSCHDNIFVVRSRHEYMEACKKAYTENEAAGTSFRALCYTNKGAKTMSENLKRFYHKDSLPWHNGDKLVIVKNFDSVTGQSLHKSDIHTIMEVSQGEFISDEFGSCEVYVLKLENGITLFSRVHRNNAMDQIVQVRRCQLARELTESLASQVVSTQRWKSFNQKIYEFDSPIKSSLTSTIHAAQGSTFDTVCVSLSEIKWFVRQFHNERLARKLCYTAISRARNRVIIHV